MTVPILLATIATIAFALGRHTLRLRLHVLTAAHIALQNDHADAHLIVRELHGDLEAWRAGGWDRLPDKDAKARATGTARCSTRTDA